MLYDEPVEQIVGWVEACLDRLAALEARTVVTLLPIDNLERLSQARFQLVADACFFPSSRIGLDEVSRARTSSTSGVRRLADERGIRRRRPIARRGTDSIRFTFVRGSVTAAWREILTAAGRAPAAIAAGANVACARTLYLRLATCRSSARLSGLRAAQAAARGALARRHDGGDLLSAARQRASIRMHRACAR